MLWAWSRLRLRRAVLVYAHSINLRSHDGLGSLKVQRSAAGPSNQRLTLCHLGASPGDTTVPQQCFFARHQTD